MTVLSTPDYYQRMQLLFAVCKVALVHILARRTAVDALLQPAPTQRDSERMRNKYNMHNVYVMYIVCVIRWVIERSIKDLT